MHHTIKNVSLCAALGVVVLLSACTKTLDAPLPVAVKGIRDSAASLRKVLQNSPYTLFYQAFTRASLDSPYAYYTVFAPSDSAMTAAGLTSSAINSLSLDSLYKLIGYHIVPGLYPDSALENDTLTVQLSSLVVTTGEAYNYYGQLGAATLNADLYLSQKEVLYVNGLPSNKGESPLEASNGWVYPVNRVLMPPAQTLWSIITSRPELSMYAEATRLVDSMNAAHYFEGPDSTLFNTIPYVPTQNYGVATIQELYTVLAPTNDAFAKAGFKAVDDLRQYINQSIPQGAQVSWPGYTNTAYLLVYNPMDSILKTHYFNNPGQSIVFYQDMLNSTAINDGWMNTNPFTLKAYQALASAFPGVAPVYDQFSNNGGVLQIKWNPNVPAYAYPYSPSNVFMGANGVVYEVDQLFYPHN
jgi:uncharacterized surface protein with fasciclin (FAS1) repeats